MSEEDKRIDNAPHDEEIEVSDGESVPDQDEASEASEASEGGSPRVGPTQSAPEGESLQFGDEFDSRDDGSPDKGGAKVPNQAYDEAVDVSSDGTHGALQPSKQNDEEEEEESEASSASEEDNEDPGKPAPGQLGQLPPAQAHPVPGTSPARTISACAPWRCTRYHASPFRISLELHRTNDTPASDPPLPWPPRTDQGSQPATFGGRGGVRDVFRRGRG